MASALTIRYTAAHPNLGPVTVHMDGPGGPYATTVADLKKCAYIVKLSVTILLTTGDGVPDPIGDEVAFCK